LPDIRRQALRLTRPAQLLGFLVGEAADHVATINILFTLGKALADARRDAAETGVIATTPPLSRAKVPLLYPSRP